MASETFGKEQWPAGREPRAGDPIYGGPDARLSLVPCQPGAKPVAVVTAFHPQTMTLDYRVESAELTETQKVEWVANTAAEEGDPDVMELGMRALEGDEHATIECLAFWELWADRRKLQDEDASREGNVFWAHWAIQKGGGSFG